MKIVLTNYSNEMFSASRVKLNESAKKHGINIIRSKSDEDFNNTEFYRLNREILSNPTGNGFWLWKPYYILETLKEVDEGDLVIYSDSGIEIINDLSPLYDICINEQPILIFANGNQINSEWTKRDCFVLMDCDNSYYWNSPHCDAAFSIWRKCELSLKFLSDWIAYGTDMRIISDNKNVCGRENIKGFIEHRRDQSILSLLASKYRLNLYRVPTQFGNYYKIPAFRVSGEFKCINQLQQSHVDHYGVIPYYNSNYGQLLNHHRKKMMEEVVVQAQPYIESKPFLKVFITKLLRGLLNKFGYEITKK